MRIEALTTISDGFKISGLMHLPGKLPAPCIICSHGLFSSKDSSKFVAMAQHLAAKGFIAIRYDHRGCGASEGQIEKTTVTSRIHDLESVYIHACQQTSYINGRFGLMGSSLGGYISLLAASVHSVFEAVVTWATPFIIRRPSKNHTTSAMAVLNDTFYTDLDRHRLSEILGGLSNCMVLHGQNDELVPVVHAYNIYQNLAEPKRFDILAGADHRFSNEKHRRQAIRCTCAFFRQYLM